MSTEPNHDSAIEKTFAALRNAAPPDGMNARIEARLRHHAAATKPGFSFIALLRTSMPGAPWWRGAATGAATAMLATGAVLFLAHVDAARSTKGQKANVTASKSTAAMPIGPVRVSDSEVSGGNVSTTPCGRELTYNLRRNAASPVSAKVRAGSYAEAIAPSHPAPALPLTAEERQLIRLAHTADPQVLSTINPETQEKLLAQQAAEFEQFFAPPPNPTAKQNNE